MGSGNTLTKIALLALVVVLGIVYFTGGGEKDMRQREADEAGLPGGESDQDGSGAQRRGDNETLLTVAAKLENFSKENQNLRQELATLREQMENLNERQAKNEQQEQQQPPADVDSIVDEVVQRVDQLMPKNQQGDGSAGATGGGPYDIGYGQDENYAPVMGAGDSTRYVRVAPRKATFNNASKVDGKRESPRGLLGETGRRQSTDPSDRLARNVDRAALEPEPRFTIPVNSTLLTNRAMTALIGRVPKGGNVRDPFPFKVATGAENYVANGKTLPADVTGIIWAGVVTGDDTFECVRGDVTSVTFVFEDGTVYTQGENRGGGGNERLGYIADSSGNPCIKGTLVSNAPKLLTGRIAASAFEAAAEAAAASETTTFADPGSNSNVASAVTGDKSDFIRGKTVAASVGETSDYIRERMKDLYDAIYVPPGRIVQVSVDQQINIDYDPVGRKLEHIASDGGNETVVYSD